MPVRVRRVDDLGRVRIAKVELSGLPMAATVPETLNVVGEDASLMFDPAMVHVYANGSLVEGEAA